MSKDFEFKDDEPFLDLHEESAGRALKLALYFINSSSPSPTDEVCRAIYDDDFEAAQLDSQKKKFERDRALLAQSGIIITSTPDPLNQSVKLWSIDRERSFVAAPALTAQESAFLYLVCSAFMNDSSFVHRDDLRFALIKLDRGSAGLKALRPVLPRFAPNKNLETLREAATQRIAVELNYQKADGEKIKRQLAPLGFFSLDGSSYFVGAKLGGEQSLSDEAPHSYRVDRIKKVTPLPQLHFDVPDDFDPLDWKALPFQVGDVCAAARFAVPAKRELELKRQVRKQGIFSNTNGLLTFETQVSSLDKAASWACFEGVVPLDPPELVERWRALLNEADSIQLFDAAELEAAGSDDVGIDAPNKDASQDASSSVETVLFKNDVVKSLISFVSRLGNEENKSLKTQDIADALGVSLEAAQNYIQLIRDAWDTTSTSLSLYDDDVLTLQRSSSISGQVLKLSLAEVQALLEVFDRVGLEKDHPLRARLQSTFSPDELGDGLVSDADSSPDFEKIMLISEALSQNQRLQFDYQKPQDKSPRDRVVIPLALEHEHELWYLRAIDADSPSVKLFRLDRMSKLAAMGLRSEPENYRRSTSKRVYVSTTRAAAREACSWHGARLVSGKKTIVELEDFGGEWLARHVLSLKAQKDKRGRAPVVKVSSQELLDRIADYRDLQLASALSL